MIGGRLSSMRKARGTVAAAVAVVLLAALVTLLVVSEGPAEATRDAAHIAGRLVRRFGPGASFAGLYLEESGVPLPVFGDVLVVYLGHRFAGSPVALVGAWLGLVATIVAGSTNLYLVSRWWGRRLVEGPLGAILHLTPERVARAERWFGRWGAPAIIFGRHILGFRVPVTVAAGLFRVPYRVFAPSVAVSTAIWAAVWLGLGVEFGDRVGRFLGHHGWTYVLIPAVAAGLTVAAVVQGWRERRLRARRK